MTDVSGKLLRNLLCLAVACAGAGTVYAGPAGPVVSAGRASYDPATLTVTSVTARTQINWQSFNVAAGETVNFIQPGAQSSVLNHVFNPYTLNIQGGLNSNGSVFFMSNSRVFGGGVNLDLAGLISSSLRLPRMAFAPSAVAALTRTRPLATLDQGRIYVIGEDERAVSISGGDVLLNPGRTIELAHGAMPKLRVELTAPDTEAVNLSRWIGGKRETGIFAGLFRAPSTARQAVQRDTEAVLTASANEATPDSPDLERFYRYALAYAQMRRETTRHEGGMMRVAAAPTGRMLLPAIKSRPRLLPQDIEIGAPVARPHVTADRLASLPPPAAAVARSVETVATLEPQPIPVDARNGSDSDHALQLALAPVTRAIEIVATLEPQPIPVEVRNEPEGKRAMLLALAPVERAVEMVATLEPQPIPVDARNESDSGHAMQLALAPVERAVEMVATLEPQPIPVAAQERLELRALASRLAAAQPAAPSQLAQTPVEILPERDETKAAPAVTVVASTPHSVRIASRGNAQMQEVHIVRRAPRYFTDYRGALFFM